MLVFTVLFHLLPLPTTDGTPEQPEFTFEHLYQFGKDAYTIGDWSDCVAFMLRALEDYTNYRNELLHCRRECNSQLGTSTASAEGVKADSVRFEEEFLRFWAGQAQLALCLLKCRQERLTVMRAPLKSYAVYREDFMQKRMPYHYLQVIANINGHPPCYSNEFSSAIGRLVLCNQLPRQHTLIS